MIQRQEGVTAQGMSMLNTTLTGNPLKHIEVAAIKLIIHVPSKHQKITSIRIKKSKENVIQFAIVQSKEQDTTMALKLSILECAAVVITKPNPSSTRMSMRFHKLVTILLNIHQICSRIP
jgi:hypothetical protein